MSILTLHLLGLNALLLPVAFVAPHLHLMGSELEYISVVVRFLETVLGLLLVQADNEIPHLPSHMTGVG